MMTSVTANSTALAGLIVNNLRSPDIIALEEVQDNSGAEINDGIVDANEYLQHVDYRDSELPGAQFYEFRDVRSGRDKTEGNPAGTFGSASCLIRHE